MSKSKTYLAGSDAEAKALADGTQTGLVIPFDKQPTMEAIADYHFDLCYRSVFKYKSDGENWLPFCPYQPGDVMVVKETWGCPPADHPRCRDGRKPQEGDQIVYRANPADDYQWGPGKPSQSGFVWRPAQWMPLWAVRTRLTVKSVQCKQVRNATPEQMLATGLASYDWDYAEGEDPQDDGAMFMYWVGRFGTMPQWASWASSCECIEDIFESFWNWLHPEHPWSENHWCWFVEVGK